MTDARLAAAVEAAAVWLHACRFDLIGCDGGNLYPFSREHEAHRKADRNDVKGIVEAALTAADAWDREHGHFRVHSITNMQVTETSDESQPYRFDWLTRLGDKPDEPREPRPVPR